PADPFAPPHPEQARALLRPGWLPGALVEEVSRRAVELLDLEAAPAAGAGAFGPPDPSYGKAVPEPERAVPEPEAAPAAGPARSRRVALSAVLGGRRSRRASCTLVLSVAGVLAAATTAAFVFDLLPGKGGGGSGSGSTASAGRPSTSAPADRSSVPEAFLGTWSGDVVQSDGTANGTMTSTITAGGTGAYVVRTRYGALGVVECDSKARLLSASTSKITLEEVTDGELRFGCTGVTATVTYTLAPGGKLAFASNDPTGGRPTATLSRGRG
ncbi:serine/threonine-protein kinase, partial [Streptomyces sp. NPDC002536]